MSRTILIADDEPHLVHIVAFNLRKTGAAVHTATNGRQCVEMAAALRPDLIITDYQMPEMDGLTACMRLKENAATAAIPVLMLTARGHRVSADERAKTNIVEMLAKPFSARDLMAKVQRLIDVPASDAPASDTAAA